jgi:hypothetical protein
MKYTSVYISGALTNLELRPDIKQVYEDIGTWCEGLGVRAYVPHLKSDPVTFAHLTPKEVYAMDRAQVVATDLTLAYIGLPSLGVGQELEIAREAGKDIVLWWFKGEKLSRMARGNPAIIAEFEVATLRDLEEKLKEVLLS